MASVNAVERAAARTVRLVWPNGRAETVRLRAIGKLGGAGEVFDIEGRPDLVAKIYHDGIGPAQRAQYARKIRWMLRNRPDLPPVPPEHRGVVQLAWPVAQVMGAPHFAGFVMEKIDFERTMELDYLLTRRQAAQEGFETDFGKLSTICYNLAALIDSLHARRIAVVDLKPINLKVYKSELYVSILDCDGFHLFSEDFLAEAPQVTPEYLAPEFHDRAVTLPHSQDRFALATIIFRLLNFGIHPYAGVAVGNRPHPSELSGRIRLGLYPYGRQRAPDVRAAPASVHDCLPQTLRELFDRSFAMPPASRPGAREWMAALAGYASRNSGALSRCEQGHLQFDGTPCPTCRRDSILRGHAVRRQRVLTRIQASPARAVTYMRRTLQGTQPSPFQAALAQAQLGSVQLTPVTLSIRNTLAVEITWAIGLLITYWWLK